jgi:hypothetical protein
MHEAGEPTPLLSQRLPEHACLCRALIRKRRRIAGNFPSLLAWQKSIFNAQSSISTELI